MHHICHTTASSDKNCRQIANHLRSEILGMITVDHEIDGRTGQGVNMENSAYA